MTWGPTKPGRLIEGQILRSRCREIYDRCEPERGMVMFAALLLRRHVVTLSRWLNGARPIPDYVWTILNLTDALLDAAGPEAVLRVARRNAKKNPAYRPNNGKWVR